MLTVTSYRTLNGLLNVRVPFCSAEQRLKVRNLRTDS